MRKTKALNELELEVAKSSILSRFMSEWGAPSLRTKFRFRETELAEIYLFPGPGIVRLCSLGCFRIEKGGAPANEILCVFDTSDAKYSEEFAISFMADCLQYFLNAADDFDVPHLVSFNFDENRRRILLFDEARGEADVVSSFKFGDGLFKLLWASELRIEEMEFIQTKGMDAFDERVDSGAVDLIRISRKSNFRISQKGEKD